MIAIDDIRFFIRSFDEETTMDEIRNQHTGNDRDTERTQQRRDDDRYLTWEAASAEDEVPFHIPRD